MKRAPVAGLMLALSLLAAGPSAAASKAETGRLTIVDLTDDFARVWQETESLPDAAKTAAFRAAFDRTAPGLYEVLSPSRTPEQQDAAALNALRRYPERREGIDQVSSRFNGMFQPALKSFEREFGPMRGHRTIYLLHSLGAFDGGMRNLPDGAHLLFGADVIARIHTGQNPRAFFHHELFHLYHGARLGPCPTTWCGLWKEGLATYVAAQLNPSATDAELLLTIPEPLRPAVAANRRAAVCAVLQRFGSTSHADHNPVFGMTRLSPELPPRFGYALGYDVAAHLGRTRSLKTLANLSQAEARPLIEASLHEMAQCGPT
jgi:hypothetical protein